MNHQNNHEEDLRMKKVLSKRFLPAPQQGKLVEQLLVSLPGVFWVYSAWAEHPKEGNALNG